MPEPKEYQVIVSERAGNMLISHVRFMAGVSVTDARRVQQDVMKAIRSLDTMPNRFPFLDADFIPKNKYHKMYVKKWYLVLYQVKDNTVFVDYIVDCRQDYAWLLDS